MGNVSEKENEKTKSVMESTFQPTLKPDVEIFDISGNSPSDDQKRRKFLETSFDINDAEDVIGYIDDLHTSLLDDEFDGDVERLEDDDPQLKKKRIEGEMDDYEDGGDVFELEFPEDEGASKFSRDDDEEKKKNKVLPSLVPQTHSQTTLPPLQVPQREHHVQVSHLAVTGDVDITAAEYESDTNDPSSSKMSILSGPFMEKFGVLWNADVAMTKPLGSINFSHVIAYGLAGEEFPRALVKTEQGKVVYAGVFREEDKLIKLNWDLRAKESNWVHYFQKGLTMMSLGRAYTMGWIKFKVGDYFSMIKQPSMIRPFLKTFGHMGTVYKENCV